MIIGLIGYAGSGKDTVAKMLTTKYGYTRYAFADRIRDLLYEMNPPIKRENNSDGGLVSLQSIVDGYGWDVAKSEIQVRQLLQNLGVGARKLFGENFWVNQIDQIMSSDKAVITDVRFLNEVEWLKNKGGQTWRVKKLRTGPVNDHISEKELEDYKVDMILYNGGTLNDLELLVQTRMDSLLHVS